MSLARDLGLLGLLPILLVAGCFNPNLDGSKFTCRQSASDCPPGFTCDPADRVCKKAISGPHPDGPIDSGAADRSATESGAPDKATLDKGTLDKGTLDKGTLDKGTLDKGTLDKSAPDKSPPDKGIDQPVAPSCTDGKKNGNETDIDCGGSCSVKCASGKGCLQATDCASGKCDTATSKCVSCADGIKNGDETDLDCGGSCAKCVDGKACLKPADCASNICAALKCVSCTDGIKNGSETDVDCGGSCSAKCMNGKGCTAAADCTSGYCSASESLCRPKPAIWVSEAGFIEVFDLAGNQISKYPLTTISGAPYSVRALDVGSFGDQAGKSVGVAYHDSSWYRWNGTAGGIVFQSQIQGLSAAATAQPALAYDRASKKLLLGFSDEQKCGAITANEHSTLLVSADDGVSWTVVDTRTVTPTITTEYRYFPRALVLHAGSWIMGTGGWNDDGAELTVNIIRQSLNSGSWNGGGWTDAWSEPEWSPAVGRFARHADESLGVYAFKVCSKQGNMVMRRSLSAGSWVWGPSGLVQNPDLDRDWVTAAMNKNGQLVGRSRRGNVYYKTTATTGWTTPTTNMPGCIANTVPTVLPDDHCMVDVAADPSTTGDFFAISGINKALYKSSDGGVTWTQIAVTWATPLELEVSRPE